ncbi:MAG: DAK2 domain-containing protein, partial [Lachnospiraceae bacterium]|nr:DAK2 domain-containing protein [Lachnospiraceae bacterium]
VINFMPESSVEDNISLMTEAVGNVKTGQLTYSVRDTQIDNINIKKDDFMAIGDSGILAAGVDMDQVLDEMFASLIDESSELISIYYGADVKEDEACRLMERVKASYPGCEIDVQYGGQPIYYYFISVE